MRPYLLNLPLLIEAWFNYLLIYFPFEGAGEMYYYVVFNGFHVTEQKITSYSKNDKVRDCVLVPCF